MQDFPDFDVVGFASAGNAILGIRDSGKSYTAVAFAERLHDAGIPFVAFDPIGRWRFIRVPGHGHGYPIVVAGGAAGDLPLTVESAKEIVRAAMQSGISLVVDLYDIEISKADWKRIVGDAVRVLLYENGSHGLRHIFIEEAAEFAPQRVGPAYGVVYAEIEKLARMGGNARLGYTLINQRAEEVNKAVLELCDNLFLHRQKGRNSLAALTKWLDIADVKPGSREIIKSLPTLPQGECWAWMSSTDRPVRVKVPPKNSYEPDRRAMRGEIKVSTPAVDVASFVSELRDRLAGKPPAAKPARQARPKSEDRDVKESEAHALRAENERLRARIAEIETKAGHPPVVVGSANVDDVIAELKRRAASDPEIIALLTKKPEIVVTVKRPTIQMDGSTPKGRVVRLLAEGFYDNGATNSQTRTELKRTGSDVNNATLGRFLAELLRDGFVTLENGSYRAVDGMKVKIVEAAA